MWQGATILQKNCTPYATNENTPSTWVASLFVACRNETQLSLKTIAGWVKVNSRCRIIYRWSAHGRQRWEWLSTRWHYGWPSAVRCTGYPSQCSQSDAHINPEELIRVLSINSTPKRSSSDSVGAKNTTSLRCGRINNCKAEKMELTEGPLLRYIRCRCTWSSRTQDVGALSQQERWWLVWRTAKWGQVVATQREGYLGTASLVATECKLTASLYTPIGRI